MSGPVVISWISGFVQLIVAAYALRLNRLFGTARVGWSLFCAFGLLALLHLFQSARTMRVGPQFALEIEVAYLLISFLLLTGLFHIESLLKERLRMEAVEKKLRADLEYQVKQKTAHLNRAIEELVTEIGERKKLQSEFEQTQEELVLVCRQSRPPERRF